MSTKMNIMGILFLLFSVTGSHSIPIPWYNSYLFEATLQELDNNQGNIYIILIKKYIKYNLIKVLLLSTFSDIKDFYPDFQGIILNPIPLMRGEDADNFSRKMMNLTADKYIRKIMNGRKIERHPKKILKYGIIRLTR